MILQALATYYERLLGEGAVPPPGFQEKEVLWVVELDRDGHFVALGRTGDEKKRGRKFAVPAEVKRAVNIAANLLWDNPEYALGIPRAGCAEAQAAKVPRRHAAFLKRLRDLPDEAQSDAGVAAVIAFLESRDFARLHAEVDWKELAHGGANVSFKLAGEMDLICQRRAVRLAVVAAKRDAAEEETEAWCLVTGARARPARLHPNIKGVRGAQPTGANLVSFNLNAFTSHCWLQGANAPICDAAADAYTAALNYLLARGNDRHVLTEGDTTFVLWAARKTAFEDRFAHLLGSYAPVERDSDGTPVHEILDNVHEGLKRSVEDPTPFYVLGLVPNAARLAVRFWHAGIVAEMAQNILAHFNDLELVGLSQAQAHGLWRLLGAAAKSGDVTKLQDQLRGELAAELMAAILKRLPYPVTMLARTVARCQAEQSVWPVRAGLIKAVLNRRSPGKEVTVSLDPDDRTPGYRLGRLFAVLENVQTRAQTDLHVTICDRYFSAAMTVPRSVFPQLMRRKNAHLKKLYRTEKTRGLAIHFDRQIDNILSVLRSEEGFPASLSLENQGRFILGYHHQRYHRTGAKGDDNSVNVPDLSEAAVDK